MGPVILIMHYFNTTLLGFNTAPNKLQSVWPILCRQLLCVLIILPVFSAREIPVISKNTMDFIK